MNVQFINHLTEAVFSSSFNSVLTHLFESKVRTIADIMTLCKFRRRRKVLIEWESDEKILLLLIMIRLNKLLHYGLYGVATVCIWHSDGTAFKILSKAFSLFVFILKKQAFWIQVFIQDIKGIKIIT